MLYIDANFAKVKQCGPGVLFQCQDSNASNIVITNLHVVKRNGDLATTINVWPEGVGYGDNTCLSATINPTRLDGVSQDCSDLVILNLSESFCYKVGLYATPPKYKND